MGRRPVSSLCILAVCLLAISCTELNPINPPPGSTPGPLTFEPTKFNNAIPDDYGALIGVSQSADPAWVALWFQKPDKTISAVFIHLVHGRIHEKSLTIPRK